MKISDGEEKKTILYFSAIQWLFIIVATLFSLFSNGLPSSVINVLIMAYTVLIGLLSNLLVTTYSASIKLNSERESTNQNIKTIKTVTDRKISLYNKKVRFIKQYGYLTTYAILLSVLVVILSIVVSLPTDTDAIQSLWTMFNLDFDMNYFSSSYQNFIYGVFRGFLAYFILDSFYIILFSLCSFIRYVDGEIAPIEKPE